MPRRRIAPSGYRIVPHTADLALEAWAPEKAECLSQAVRALAESFATVRPGVPSHALAAAVEWASDEDLLVAVLNEAIFLAEVRGEVAVAARASWQATAGRTEVEFTTVPATGVQMTGAVPKAVSWHELSFAHDGSGWRCHVTIDV